MDCIRCGLHWIENFIFSLNCIGLRSRMKSRQMDVDRIAIGLDWTGLEIRRDIVGGIRSRAKIQFSQMSTTAWRQFFLKVFKKAAYSVKIVRMREMALCTYLQEYFGILLVSMNRETL